MLYEKYAERKLRKIQKSLELYSRYLFVRIFEIDSVLALETHDQLRIPPESDSMNRICKGTQWGTEYSNLWLRFKLSVPDEAEGTIICAIPDTGAIETLCFKNGIPSGIINSKNKFIGGNHSFMFVTPNAKTGEEYDIAFECYAGHTKLGTRPLEKYDVDETVINQNDFRHLYNGIRVCKMDTLIRDCIFDMSVALQLAQLPEDNYMSQRAYEYMEEAYKYFIQDPMTVSDEYLRESAKIISTTLEPLLRKTKGDASRGYVALVGHSHMDTAWTWPVSETIRKCARTYSQVMTLMDMYPEYTFIQSSSLHIDWMKNYYPELYKEIRKRIIEGRYEPNGAVWVECDCNVPSGEAMARQFIYGQRFTRSEFGYTSDCFWLPDTFGYNAAIPQILKHSGVKYFFTTKLSWNDLNVFPMGSFYWKGIDGTKVLCHLGSINSMPDPKTITQVYTHVTNRRIEKMRLAAYGYGDGGGGPTYGMLEYLRRVIDLEGMPVLEHSSVSRFMRKLESESQSLPIFDGELYFEMHRGTLTKMHEVKRLNRYAEMALHDLELVLCAAGIFKCDELEKYWKTLLINQFHDILPGTSIPKVYEKTIPEMRNLLDSVRSKTLDYLNTVAHNELNTLCVYNTLSFDRADIVTVDGSIKLKNTAVQEYVDINGKTKTAFFAKLPAMSSKTFSTESSLIADCPFEVKGRLIDTPFYKILFDENGYIEEMYDKTAQRRVDRKDGVALGTLYCGEAVPDVGDNWDIDDDGFDKLKPVNDLIGTEIVSIGPVEIRMRSRYRVGQKSLCIMDTVLYAESRRIDYEVQLDWKERHQLLKAGFDLEIRTGIIKNEIQFGHVDRPTTRNNSFEAAKFEVSNHKWSDISETKYGVALLNDSKYGISALGSDVRLTLMAPGCRPDPVTDIGIHYMKYALLPHIGQFDANRVVQQAYSFNYSPIVMKNKDINLMALFKIDADNIICEAVKPAYDYENAYILRLYECERSRTKTTIHIYKGREAYITNFLEEKIEDLRDMTNGTIEMEFAPFEIKTILVRV